MFILNCKGVWERDCLANVNGIAMSDLDET